MEFESKRGVSTETNRRASRSNKSASGKRASRDEDDDEDEGEEDGDEDFGAIPDPKDVSALLLSQWNSSSCG